MYLMVTGYDASKKIIFLDDRIYVTVRSKYYYLTVLTLLVEPPVLTKYKSRVPQEVQTFTHFKTQLVKLLVLRVPLFYIFFHDRR